MRRLSQALIDGLSELHAVDVKAAGLADYGRPEGYVERQVTGWTERYFKAKTDEVPEVEEAAAWLAQNLQPERGAALIHGDFKYDNLVLDPGDLTSIIAVLDWEMATVGDPLMDLGVTLGYWIDPTDPEEHRMLPFGPTLLPGNLTRMELVERYAKKSGLEVGKILFHYVYALFKIAVIAQQIYKRFKEGHTKDPRFAMMIMGVQILGKTATRAIEKDRIYDLA
jgi:aminoglycoside phosphotransferase (APT) family kinase protein